MSWDVVFRELMLVSIFVGVICSGHELAMVSLLEGNALADTGASTGHQNTLPHHGHRTYFGSLFTGKPFISSPHSRPFYSPQHQNGILEPLPRKWIFVL